jgi:carbamoyl-phosphate synthase large subunit
MVIRPSFTMGGTGGGIAYNPEEFEEICKRGLDLSPTKELLIEESLIGWKEFEMEVVRDRADNCIIVCSSRTSTRWASTPATASRWRRRRR